MTGQWDNAAVEAVRSIKAAISESQERLDASGLEVSKVELALETALTKGIGGEFKIKVVGIEAHRTRADTQTLTLDLTPTKRRLEDLGPSLADELADAIVATAAAATEAASTEPRFNLDSAEVALQVEISNDGKVSLFVEGSGALASTNTLTLTLKPKE